MRWLLAIGLVVLAATRAHADPEPPARAVALLPLDADAKLELYGQPVASEVARALREGGVEVEVVGPKMAVPANARLVVDGTIKAGKGNTVVLTMRIRDAFVGTVYDTVPVTAATQTAMDHAAEELAGKVLPSVKGRLATLIAEDEAKLQKPEVKPVPKPLEAPKHPQMLVAVTGKPGEPLVTELATDVAMWAARRHHEVRVVDPQRLGKAAAKTVAAEKAELSIELEVLSLATDHDDNQIPLTTARVHIRIADQQSVVFDRVIVTDTIVGEKNLKPAKLYARVAREVLAIADPQLKRRIPTWY
jgi:hypothetical protein